MPATPEPDPLSGNHAQVADEIRIIGLDVEGAIPPLLCGQYALIGPNPIGLAARCHDGAASDGGASDGTVHAVALGAGGTASYRSRRLAADATTNLITFCGRILALGDGVLAHELSSAFDTIGRVDLAGGARGIGAHPKFDPETGALYLISSPGEPTATIHVISPGGLTRTSRPLTDAPAPVHDIAFTRDRLVVLGDGVIGCTPREGQQSLIWFGAASTPDDRVINAHDDGDTIVVHVAGPTVQVWTLDPARGHAEHAVIHDAARGFACINDRILGQRHRYIYSTGVVSTVPLGTTVLAKRDLLRCTQESHDFGDGRYPGAFGFVGDPARSCREDGGWLVGFVHTGNADQTQLVVLDAVDVQGPPLAAVQIPRHIFPGPHGLWLPSPA